MKKICIWLLIFCLLLSGCLGSAADTPKSYNATYLDLFDTVTTIVGSGESEEQFREAAQSIYEELKEYHRLFDIYREYDGISNLKTVNDQAGVAPVKVDCAIIDLLLDCKNY